MSAGKDVGVSCPLAAWRGRRKCLPLPPSLSRLFIFPPLSPRSTFLVFGLLESQNPDLGPRPIPSWLAARARPRLQAPPLPGGHHGRSSAQPLEFTEAAASSPSPLGPEMGTEEAGSSDSRHQVCPGPEPPLHLGTSRESSVQVGRSCRGLQSLSTHTWRGSPQPGCRRPSCPWRPAHSEAAPSCSIRCPGGSP